MADGAEGDRSQGAGVFGWIRKLDDGVFAVEQAIVAVALIGITAMVFVDVIARRITAPDSKVGELIAKLAGIDDLETRDWIGANVAPWVTLVLGVVLAGFAFYSARRIARQRAVDRGEDVEAPPLGRELGFSLGFGFVVIAAAWGFGAVFEQLESWMLYAAIFAIGGLAYAAVVGIGRAGDGGERRRPSYWQARALVAVALGAGMAWLAHAYVPIGYTWSKKVSLMLLLWVGLLSASICVHEGKHIRLEALGKLVPDKAQRWLRGGGGVVAAGFCAVMTWLGFYYIFMPEPSDDEYMTEMLTLFGTRYVYGYGGAYQLGGLIEGTQVPDWIATLSVPVGFGIATFRFLGAGVSALLGGTYGAPAPEEGLEEARQFAEGHEAEAAGVEGAAEEVREERAALESEAEAEAEPGSDLGDEGEDDDGADHREKSR
ncbi:MAG TPA: TRAP transporter small permease subunit [Sandaracinaceae bacterium LLY-WYZ-13_1]|nr:TRAP transporter small permease subunit [Sandaracinaceae bacterium LLY-WYZ-13_1]